PCDQNFNTTFTLTGTATDFAGFFDPGPPRGGPAFPKRLNVTSTGNVTISNIELISPTQIRFAANLRNVTLGSQQTLTITNPDCQSVVFNYTIPATCEGVINPPPGNSFRVSPNPVVNGSMNVVTPDATGSLRLIATDGKVLDQFTVNGGSITIETSRYATGLYYLEFQGSSSKEVITVFIERK
nr:T9SS type A sorting domain-containing protein [Chitinophagaceae bacterium]